MYLSPLVSRHRGLDSSSHGLHWLTSTRHPGSSIAVTLASMDLICRRAGGEERSNLLRLHKARCLQRQALAGKLTAHRHGQISSSIGTPPGKLAGEEGLSHCRRHTGRLAGLRLRGKHLQVIC